MFTGEHVSSVGKKGMPNTHRKIMCTTQKSKVLYTQLLRDLYIYMESY